MGKIQSSCEKRCKDCRDADICSEVEFPHSFYKVLSNSEVEAARRKRKRKVPFDVVEITTSEEAVDNMRILESTHNQEGSWDTAAYAHHDGKLQVEIIGEIEPEHKKLKSETVTIIKKEDKLQENVQNSGESGGFDMLLEAAQLAGTHKKTEDVITTSTDQLEPLSQVEIVQKMGIEDVLDCLKIPRQMAAQYEITVMYKEEVVMKKELQATLQGLRIHYGGSGKGDAVVSASIQLPELDASKEVDSDLQSALLQFNDGCILRSIQPHNFYLRKITSNPLNFFPASCADVMRNSDVTNDAMKQAEVGCEHLLFCYENFFHEWSRFVKDEEAFHPTVEASLGIDLKSRSDDSLVLITISPVAARKMFDLAIEFKSKQATNSVGADCPITRCMNMLNSAN